jgi:hypothetical protein
MTPPSRPVSRTRCASAQVGLVKLYDQLMGSVPSTPFTARPELDLRAYVTGKALDRPRDRPAEVRIQVAVVPAAARAS